MSINKKTQDELKKEFEELCSSNLRLLKVDNRKYSMYFTKPQWYEEFGEAFHKIWDIVNCSQEWIDVLWRKFSTVYFKEFPSKVWKTLNKDTYLLKLLKESKWNVKSTNFINLYKSLIALKTPHNEIKEFFNLDDGYLKWIKNYL